MKLFIDTAVKGCHLALFDETKLIAVCSEPIERGHAETLLPMLEAMLSDCEKTPQDISEVFVTVGPGSFTGLRVGLTVAQFVGYTLGIPVHGVTTFQAFSVGCAGDKNRLILIETKRSDFYVQHYNAAHHPIGDPQSLTATDILVAEDDVLTGDATKRFLSEKNVPNETVQQDMIDVAAVVAAIQKNALTLQKPEAFYIRDADVSQPKPTKR